MQLSNILKYSDILELRNTKEVEDKLLAPLGEANFEVLQLVCRLPQLGEVTFPGKYLFEKHKQQGGHLSGDLPWKKKQIFICEKLVMMSPFVKHKEHDIDNTFGNNLCCWWLVTGGVIS